MGIMTTTTGARCAHESRGMLTEDCPWCAPVARAGNLTVTVASARSATRLAASVRRAIMTAQRERWETAGYALMSARTVRVVSDTAQRIGERYAGSDAAQIASETLQRIATYCGQWHDDDDGRAQRVRSILTNDRHAAALARRAAHQIARNGATGRGSMPRLTVDDRETDKRIRDLFARAHAGAPFAVTIERDGARARRSMTDIERETVRRLMRHERVERAPGYSPFVDAFGDGAPVVGTAHPMGHRAPGLPERDAPSMRRGTVRERMIETGAPIETVRAVAVIERMIETGAPMSWRVVRETVGERAHAATLARRVRAAIETARTIENRDGYAFAPDCPIPDDGARWTIERTGRFPRRWDDGGRSVVITGAAVSAARWETVRAHLPECTPRPFAQSIRCAPGCTALQLVLPVRDGGLPDDDGGRSVHPMVRRLMLARWARIDDGTAHDIVRATIERDVYGARLPVPVRNLP